ncbi:GspE/PulE family protein [Thiomicrorhabdus sp.]|uniref:GspE/PulE family protein n=1 Tax=Thiomicrorhabdus sp. TaxID=2039724 RepID=UPI0029C760F1|nr:ATPase, T2SS/T4P/T4SS family [Thiomicrorhabdus sp.]
MRRQLLGELLLESGHISKDQLHIALLLQKQTGSRLGQLLVEQDFLSRSELHRSLSQQNGIESIELSGLIPDLSAIELIDEAFARHYSVLPIAFIDGFAQIAVVDSENLLLFDRIDEVLSAKDIEWRPVIADLAELQSAIDRYYGYALSIDEILGELEQSSFDGDVVDGNLRHPLVRLLDSFLVDAVKRNASDLHFEPENNYLRIRYRIDGVLKQVRLLHKQHWAALCVRIKVLCDLDISEQRLPQDGSFTLKVGGYMTDFRVSVLPGYWGENVVIRVLNRERGVRSLPSLQLPDCQQHQLEGILKQPSGIILVNGPTGSGKTTTLYSILNELNQEGVNIMTLEDPVEYLLTGIRQTAVSEMMGFADGLRAILRQDPDIILIGEIRDQETARMAFRAAMTGHKVLATLHSNDAFSCLQRLKDLGVPRDWIADNLHAVIAQRLARRLCCHCKALSECSNQEDNSRFYTACGCSACDQSGYNGRLLLWECVVVGKELSRLLAEEVSKDALSEQAAKDGAVFLQQSAELWLQKGETSIQEIQRVLALS